MVFPSTLAAIKMAAEGEAGGGSVSSHRDANCDVLVVGGGGAGLAAAIEAADHGARVTLIEKNEALGGTTAWSIGSFTATRTPHQEAQGITDSPDEHFADMIKFAGAQVDRDNPALRRLFVDNAPETLRWLMAQGVEFHGPMPEPPHGKPRMHNVLPNSKAYVHHLDRRARHVGVDIRLATRATRFLRDGDRVVGATCECPDGTTADFTAGAVVLASGDYAASEELKARFISDAVARVDAMNPTATGEARRCAWPCNTRRIGCCARSCCASPPRRWRPSSTCSPRAHCWSTATARASPAPRPRSASPSPPSPTRSAMS
jgi:fumarate reductase flavoprotein subunit